jgi:hypothetical protein
MMAELYLVLGKLFRKFGLELFETTRARDIDVVRDSLIEEPVKVSLCCGFKAAQKVARCS